LLGAYISGRAQKLAYEHDKARKDLIDEQLAQLAFQNSPEGRKMAQEDRQMKIEKHKIDLQQAEINRRTSIVAQQQALWENSPEGQKQKRQDREIERRRAIAASEKALQEARNAKKGPQRVIKEGENAAGKRVWYSIDPSGKTPSIEIPVGGPAPEKDREFKAAVSNANRAAVAAHFNGFLDESGRMRFTDPTVAPKVAKISAMADKITWDHGGKIGSNEAAQMALLAFGEPVTLSMEEKILYMKQLTEDQQKIVRLARDQIEIFKAEESEKEIQRGIATIKRRLRDQGINPSVL